MTIFFVTLSAVAVLLLTAVPGYLFIRCRVVPENATVTLSKLLLFFCQPCLAVYTFKSCPFSWEKLGEIGLFALLTLGIHALMLGAAYLILRRRGRTMPVYRIITVATTFGNCAFFGIPILEAILPQLAPELLIFTTVYATVMNIIGWTVGSAIMAHDLRYISLKKILLNPATLGTAVALLLFMLPVTLPDTLLSMITICGRMASPLSMLVMGMRLATVPIGDLFRDPRVYLTVGVKQLLMPLITLLLLLPLPVALPIKQAFFIISACPVASIVLNFSEIIGEGQRTAASLVLFGTALSLLTLPVMMLLFPLLG